VPPHRSSGRNMSPVKISEKKGSASMVIGACLLTETMSSPNEAPMRMRRSRLLLPRSRWRWSQRPLSSPPRTRQQHRFTWNSPRHSQRVLRMKFRTMEKTRLLLALSTIAILNQTLLRLKSRIQRHMRPTSSNASRRRKILRSSWII
jgi:hypothetical protein